MSQTLDTTLIRSEFPLTREWSYLASASNGILPERSRRFLARYFAEHHYLELQRHYNMFEDLASIRSKAAGLFGGDGRNWALLPNTSHGINAAASAIDWRKGDNVVLADCEFPANVSPWKNLSDRGVTIRWAKAVDRKARAELLMATCDTRTRALAVSGVQFLNGYVPDLEALSSFCRERSIWLSVDGIQGLGNRHWDAAVLGVDFLAAGGQKWLCSPRGSGLLYLSDRALDALEAGELRQSQLGWLNTERWKFTDLLDFDRPLTTDARRLEVGTYAFHDLICLGHALDLFGEPGIEAIEAHCDGIRDRFLDDLDSRGLTAPGGPFTPSCIADPPRHRSQIVTLACPDPLRAWRELAKRKIAVNPREGGIRIAFHLYNDEDDVDRLLEGLAAIQTAED